MQPSMDIWCKIEGFLRVVYGALFSVSHSQSGDIIHLRLCEVGIPLLISTELVQCVDIFVLNVPEACNLLC